MTRKQIAESLGIHIQIVHDAFERCCKVHPEIKEKAGAYSRNKAAEYTIDEILLAMSFARDGKGISRIEQFLLREDFKKIKPETPALGIDGTEEFLRKVRNFPKKKCCSTCAYCVKAFARNRKPVAKPYCKIWSRFLNRINVNPYKDWCKQWEYSGTEPLVFFKAEEPANLDMNGNVKNEVMGFDISNFHSHSDGEIRLVNEIGIDIDDSIF